MPEKLYETGGNLNFMSQFKDYYLLLDDEERKKLINVGVLNLNPISNLTWLSGHFYEDDETKEITSFGPEKLSKNVSEDFNIVYDPNIKSNNNECILMIVGLHPGKEEISNKRNFCGPSGKILISFIKSINEDFLKNNKVYLTNLIKIWCPFYTKNTKFKKEDIEIFGKVLEEEIKLVKPKNLLLLGDDVLKFLLGYKEKLKDYYGNFVIKELFNSRIRVFALPNPVSVIYNPQTIKHYKRGLSFVINNVFPQKGQKLNTKPEYKLCVDKRELEIEVDKILKFINETGEVAKISFDMEWRGERPDFSEESSLICFQFYSEQTGCVIYILQDKDDHSWVESIKKILLHEKTQIIGHFFQADAVWLHKFGIDITDKYTVPDNLNSENIKYPEDLDYPGGFDISLAVHSLYETDSLDLCNIAVKELGVNRWDTKVDIKNIILNNYFYDYCANDAFFTFKISERLKEKLFRDDFNQNCINPFLISMRAIPAFMKMMINGIDVNKQKLNKLSKIYEDEKVKTEDSLRVVLNFPSFNPRSIDHEISVLFGENYLLKIKNKRKIKILPEGALCLNITPEFFTDNGLPATDKKSFAYYRKKYKYYENISRVLDLLVNYKLLSRAVDHIKKIENNIGIDGKVKSFFVQTKETGRASSSSPNLQNIPKDVEEEYKLALDKKYPGSVRSIFEAPEGRSFLSLDLSGAEILVGAVAAFDEEMIKDYYSSILFDENDERHVDIPSKIAVDAFNLGLKPSKSELKKNGYSYLRDAAKRLIYGYSYGGSSKTIYNNMIMAGVDIEYEKVKKLMDSFSTRYYKRFYFNEFLEKYILKERWISNCFGRKRRFYVITKERDRFGENKIVREALNFIPQSTVADSISTLLSLINKNQRFRKLGGEIILQIHDEIIVSSPDENVEEIKNILLEESKKVKIYHANLKGEILVKEGFNYGTNVNVFKVWE